MLKQIPGRAPRSSQQIDSFIESLSSNDARIEIIVGQGRLLTLKQDLAAQGQPNDPIIAIGDRSVVVANVLSSRHLRLTGRRIGVTDLSILTANRENYSFEIHVIADLDYLRGKIRQRFPYARIKLGHIREHLVAEGTARDLFVKQQIIKMIKAYLKSVQADMRSQSAGGASYSREDQPKAAKKTDDKQGGGEVVSESTTAASIGQSAEPEVIDLIQTPDPLILLRLHLKRLFPLDWSPSREALAVGTEQ